MGKRQRLWQPVCLPAMAAKVCTAARAQLSVLFPLRNFNAPSGKGKGSWRGPPNK